MFKEKATTSKIHAPIKEGHVTHLSPSVWPVPIQRSRSDSQTLRVVGHLGQEAHPATARCTQEGDHVKLAGSCLILFSCDEAVANLRGLEYCFALSVHSAALLKSAENPKKKRFIL